MELYLTYHKVLDKLQEFQQNYCCLNTFGYGNLVDFGKNVSGQTVDYPYLFVVPQSVTYDQNTTTYQLSCIFADRLNESLDNEKDAVSDMSLAARQLLSEIWRGNLQDYFDTALPVNGLPFMERFNDYVAGVALDLSIVVMEDINACEQWIVTPFPSASPTATPTVTPTPSVTPGFTPGPTPSVTQTATPSATPVVPVNPSTLGALWWVDFHTSSNIILSGTDVLAAKDLISNNYIFSAYTSDAKPQYESSGYLSLSGCVTNGNNRGLSTALGLYGSITEYTQFWNVRRNVGPSGYISESDNRMNYLDQQQGYRWFSVDDSGTPDYIRTYTFYATGESVSPEPAWSADTNFHFGATRIYQNGSDVTTELWIDGAIVSTTTNLNRSPITATNPTFNLLGNNIACFDSTEQFFFDRKLTNSEMSSAFAYLNQKYPNQ